MLCCINFGDLTYLSTSVDDNGIHSSAGTAAVVGIVDLVVVVVDSVVVVVVDGSVVVDLSNRCVVDDVNKLRGVPVML